MASLLQQRCFNHAAREAVARCPECRQFFCRECITEHDQRVICAGCLKKLARVPLHQRPAFTGFVQLLHCTIGLVLAWFCFYLIAEGLLKLPDEFHNDSLWGIRWYDRK